MNPWLVNVSVAALALPASCLAQASQAWDFSEGDTWQVPPYATRQTKTFIEIIHMRQKMYEEIG